MKVDGKVVSIYLIGDEFLVSIKEIPMEGVIKYYHSTLPEKDALKFTVGQNFKGELSEETTSTELTTG